MTDMIIREDKPSLVAAIVDWPTVVGAVLCLLAIVLYLLHWIPLPLQVFGLAIIFVIAVGELRMFLRLLAREYTLYTLTESNFLEESGIRTKRQTTIPLEKVESVSVEQDLLGKRFDFGTLVIHATDAGDVRIVRVAHPHFWHTEILNQKSLGPTAVKGLTAVLNRMETGE